MLIVISLFLNRNQFYTLTHIPTCTFNFPLKVFKKNINTNGNFLCFVTKRTQNKQIHIIYI